jgi:hypothetical protein
MRGEARLRRRAVRVVVLTRKLRSDSAPGTADASGAARASPTASPLSVGDAVEPYAAATPASSRTKRRARYSRTGPSTPLSERAPAGDQR